MLISKFEKAEFLLCCKNLSLPASVYDFLLTDGVTAVFIKLRSEDMFLFFNFFLFYRRLVCDFTQTEFQDSASRTVLVAFSFFS